MLSRGLQALALQRRADRLLVLLTSPTLVWELPGKVFEYFGARRRFSAAEGNEAARLIRETGTGWTVPPGDVDAIVARIRALLADGPTLEYDDARLAPYVYPAPAEAFEAEVERALAARGRVARVSS